MCWIGMRIVRFDAAYCICLDVSYVKVMGIVEEEY